MDALLFSRIESRDGMEFTPALTRARASLSAAWRETPGGIVLAMALSLLVKLGFCGLLLDVRLIAALHLG
jgi:hypothetical protein